MKRKRFTSSRRQATPSPLPRPRTRIAFLSSILPACATALWLVAMPHEHATKLTATGSESSRPLPPTLNQLLAHGASAPSAGRTQPLRIESDHVPAPAERQIPMSVARPPVPSPESHMPAPPIAPPDPQSTRPPMDNPGGVNGSRPPRPGETGEL